MDRDVRALLVEDSAEDALVVTESLRAGGLTTAVCRVSTLAEGVGAIEEDPYDVVLLDLSLPDVDGLETVRRMAVAAGPVPIVVLTGHDDEELALRAVQQGAQDYLVKGSEDPVRLVRSIRYAIERKRTEALLQASQAYFRSLTEKASDVVLILDPEARIRYVSRSIERVLGYRPEEREGRSALELVHRDDLPKVRRALVEGVATPGATALLEARVRAARGEWVWIEATGVNLADDPAVRGILVTWRDITGRRVAEEHVRFQARLLDAVGQAVFAQELDGTITYWGAGAERVFGWSAEEAVGRRSADLIMPDTPEAREHQRLNRDAVMGREPFRREMVARRKDGSTIVIEGVGTPLLTPGGELVGMVGVATDVSARKAAENALRESERRFRALIESAADALLVLTPEGRLRYASPAGRVFLRGVMEGEPVEWSEVVHPEDVGRLREAWRAVLEAPEEEVDVEVRARDGTRPWRDLEVSLRNLLDVGGVEGVVVHARDVTERHDLEQRLREAQRLEAVGRLAGGIAHDFNNIVTGMKGFVRLVLEEAGPDSPWRRDLEEVERLGERAADLTRQLLAFSRRQVLQPRVVDLGEVVDETQRMLRRVIGEDVAMEVRLCEGPCRVRVDPTQIEQVVLNLVMNARDAMPRGGHLTLETGHATLAEAEARDAAVDAGAGTYAFVRVRDDGVGMTAEVREQAFEPFFTTKEPGRGTGLGLSTVFGIVKQSGGGVALESEPGHGTAVTVFLPPAAAAPDGGEAAEAPAAPVAPRPSGRRVLVVEDDPSVRAILERVLEREGFEVLSASDGEEALARLEADDGRIDLLVTDLVMPGMGGRELSRRLAQGRPGLRALLVSGYSVEEVARGGAREPWESFLEKPFTPQELLAEVRRILSPSERRD